MWELRDAVRNAGHYRSAPEAARFYKTLADQIDAACDDGRLMCLPARASTLPPFRLQYVADTLESTKVVSQKIFTFGGGQGWLSAKRWSATGNRNLCRHRRRCLSVHRCLCLNRTRGASPGEDCFGDCPRICNHFPHPDHLRLCGTSAGNLSQKTEPFPERSRRAGSCKRGGRLYQDRVAGLPRRDFIPRCDCFLRRPCFFLRNHCGRCRPLPRLQNGLR